MAEISSKFQIILDTCKKNKDIDSYTRERFNIKKHTIIPLDEQKRVQLLQRFQMIIFIIQNLEF